MSGHAHLMAKQGRENEGRGRERGGESETKRNELKASSRGDMEHQGNRHQVSLFPSPAF